MSAPPLLAELVLAELAGDRDTRDAVLGDMAEEHEARCVDVGSVAAARWYWRQTLASVLPLGAAALRRAQAGAWARVAVAVVAGYAALILLMLLSDAGLARVMTWLGAGSTAGWPLAASLGIGGICAVAGGWITAAVGRRAPLASAAALGAAFVAVNLIALFAGASRGPRWYWVAFGIVVLHGSVAGGLLRLRQQRARPSQPSDRSDT